MSASLQPRHRNSLFWALGFVIVLVCVALSVGMLSTPARAEGTDETGSVAQVTSAISAAETDTVVTTRPDTTRPSFDGALSVEGTQLVNVHGDPVALRGLSTHGISWFPQFVNEQLFKQLSQEWDCDLIRLAFYSKNYCEAGYQDRKVINSTLLV